MPKDSRLDEHSNMALAIALTERKVRTSIIEMETNISATKLRELYREIHSGVSPVPGPSPNSDTILATRKRVVEASIVMNLYVRRTRNGAYRTIDAWALLSAYDDYIEHRAEAGLDDARPLSVSEAWLLARELRSKKLELRPCSCGCRYAVLENQCLKPNCPVCGAENKPAPQPSTAAARPGRTGEGDSPFAESIAASRAGPIAPISRWSGRSQSRPS